MMRDLALVALGAGIVATCHLVMHWFANRPRRSRMDGSYFDARKPFAIVSRGQQHGPERSEELIARTARRLHRATHKWPEA